MKKGVNVLGLSAVFFVMVIVSLFIGAISAAEADEIVIDTEKGVPGFWTEPTRDLPGNWQYVHDHPDSSADGWFDTKAYPPGNGSFWYTISFPDMSECSKGIWMASLPHSGAYEVFAWIPHPDPFDPYLDEATPPSDYLPTKRAQYKVFHNGGVATVTVDQNVNRGGFTSFGVFEFDTTARVELSSNGVEFWRCVAFDAVKFVPIQTPIDTTAPGNNQTGKGTEDTVPQLAPLNPDFVAYWENPPETSFGYIPPPVDLSHLDQIPVVGLPTLDKLPSSFDWRDQGKVTSVKDQTPCGTCWVFGTTSVLESAVLIGESVVYDFSEQSVALCVDRSWYYLYDGPTDPCNGGGWSWLASEVFIKKGSVQETCNPYDTSALQCDGSCVCDDCPPIKKVDGYRLATNDGSQIDVIKNAVYNHGPVTMTYYSVSGYYWVAPWGTIYDNYPCYGYGDHLVSIIGWDDDVPHPNPSHTGTGAWIVKNSWGPLWGNNGFFYLAYNSGCVKEIAYLTYKDNNPDEELLYWDEAGLVGFAYDGDNSAWMANVFTAPKSGDLTHVDFWTTSNNAQYELYVWNGFFGSELAHQTGTCQEYGYYSILLSESISLDAGQQFTVGVKMTTPGFGYPIPVEFEIPGRVDPPIQTDVSFIRHTDSGSWTDLADYGENACLRARLTVIVPPEITSFAPPSPVNDTACTWRTFNVTVNQTVNVSWYLNGTFQFTNVSVREASCRLHAEVVGEHNVTANATNANGTDMQTWIWNVTPSAPPKIIYPDFTDTDTPGNWRTWMGVMNTGDTSTTLRLDVYNPDGSVAYSNPNFVTLEPKAVHFFRPGITAGIGQGSAIVSGDNLAGTCHVNKNGGEGTKVYTALASGSSTLYYPDFTDTDTSGNWRTWIAVMNAGTTNTTLRLDVYNPDGSLAYTNSNFVTLEPKAVHFFRPGITAGIAQGDAVVSGDNLAGTCHVNKNGGEGTKVYTAIGG